MNESEKRVHTRHACDLSIWLRRLSTDDDYEYADVMNIGMGGALCKVQGRFRINQPLDIAFQLPTRPAMVGITGKVAHVIREGGVSRLGVEFTDAEGVALNSLMSFILQQ